MIIEVKMADYYIGKKNNTLASGGIGSCLGICLLCKKSGTGILFHAMLPTYKKNSRITNFLKFVDSGLYIVLADYYKKTGLSEIQAKIIGGAKLFGNHRYNIGFENIKKAREILRKEDIKIISEDTGGDFGRNIQFDVGTGKVKVNTLKEGNYII
ncbi:MAG: chemotaxis protein CheD [Candidatus Muiribacteriota bacterium]